MDESALEKIYQERLEEHIISDLAERRHISLENAMKMYYNSRLAERIQQGQEGVQYLDHKLLAQIMEETEPELFTNNNG